MNHESPYNVDKLVAFLLERLRDTASAARGAWHANGSGSWTATHAPDADYFDHDARESHLATADGKPIFDGASNARTAALCADQDPESVLADILAKERIIQRYQKIQALRRSPPLYRGTSPKVWRLAELELRHVLELLALPYAYHRDYRKEWTP